MKKLLFVLLLSICAIAWRSDAIMRTLADLNLVSAPKSYSLQAVPSPAGGAAPAAMSLNEFEEQAKKDAEEATRKFIKSHEKPEERSELDKLMSFFTRLKYE